MDPNLAATQLGTIALFCRAAELGSFSKAAGQFGLTPAAVSRGIGRLEERLGVKLFKRTTRRVNLTEDGRLYFEECRQAIAQIETVEQTITGAKIEPKGMLKVACPAFYAHYRLLALLARYRERFPSVDVEVQIGGGVDLLERGFDLVIAPHDSNLPTALCAPLENASIGVFASPAYLKRAGRPKTVSDLNAHHCIALMVAGGSRAQPWLFRDAGHDLDVPVSGSMRSHDDTLAAVTMARAGAGLVQTCHFVAQPYLNAGELIEVLKPFAGRHWPMTLVYPRNRHTSARVRSFVEFLSAALRANPN